LPCTTTTSTGIKVGSSSPGATPARAHGGSRGGERERATSAEGALPCREEGVPHHLSCQSVAHVSLHQEETRTPRGVHCPKACLLQSRGVTTLHQGDCLLSSKPIAAEGCTPACLFANPIRQHTPGSAWQGGHSLHAQTQAVLGPAWLPACQGALDGFGRAHSAAYHLAHGRLTCIQRLFDAEACSTPVLNHTQQCLRTALRPMEYSLLQPRSAPEDAPAGVSPSRHSDPLRPLYTPMLCSSSSLTATAVVDCEAHSASLTWAPSILGAAHFGR